MRTFDEFIQNCSVEDTVTDIRESVLTGSAAQAVAIAIVAKMTQIGRSIKGPDGKATSSQLVLLAGLVILAMNAVSESGRR